MKNLNKFNDHKLIERYSFPYYYSVGLFSRLYICVYQVSMTLFLYTYYYKLFLRNRLIKIEDMNSSSSKSDPKKSTLASKRGSTSSLGVNNKLS